MWCESLRDKTMPVRKSRKVPQGLSKLIIKLGPIPFKLYPDFVKWYFAEIGKKCAHDALKVTWVETITCPEHGFYTFVFFKKASHAAIALGLDDEDDEENCFARHEIQGMMVQVIRASATTRPRGTTQDWCCKRAHRA